MAQDSVKVSLEIATQAAELALKNLKKTTQETNDFWTIFKANFAAQLSVEGIKTAFGAISGFVSTVVEKSSEAQQAVHSMNVALQSAGIYSAATSKHFQELADAVESTTIYSGEATLEAVGLLASLTNLDKNGLTQATKAAVDLAATLNMDLGSATDMIAKAVNGNMIAFGRLGIEIQKGKTDSETLANVTKALASQQGAAAKKAEEYEGAMAKLKSQHENMLESLGDLITKNTLVTSGINTLTGIFSSLAKTISENKDNIFLLAKSMGIATVAVGLGAAAWALYTSAAGTVTVALVAVELAAQAAWTAATGPVGLAIMGITALGVAIFAVVKYWDDIKIAIYDATAATLEYAAKAASIVSGEAEASLKAEAQAFRDKATAVREAAAAEAEAKKQAEEKQNNEDDEKAAAEKRKKDLEDLRKYNAERNAAQNEYNATLKLQQQETDLALQEQKTLHEEAMFMISGEYDGQFLQKQLEAQQARLNAKHQFEQQELQAQIDADKAKALLIEDQTKREQALRDAGFKATLAQNALNNKQTIEQTKSKNQAEERLEAQRVANKRDTFNTIAGLQSSSNKELATVGKAFALYDIGVNTATGISKAWALGPIVGPPAAALVAAAGAAQMATVAGLKFAQGGIVPGTSYSGDKVTANVNSREMILNMGQQRRLFDIANGGGSTGNGETNSLLVELISAVKSGATINIDGKQVFSVFRDSVAAGRTF